MHDVVLPFERQPFHNQYDIVNQALGILVGFLSSILLLLLSQKTRRSVLNLPDFQRAETKVSL